ncbi:DNA alkylation repair protein [Ornithinibacillus salinisoli]|uniref:DNA alkylation repair protein n=1 Tax=Ornithinibacillus salinisoli TaxID=1848459 RepID=A0ABW4VZ55_9BACI
MGDYVPLKLYFDEQLAIRLSKLIREHYPSFSSNSFISSITKQVEGKELKARVEVIADELYVHLPNDYSEAISVLLQIIGPENESEEGMFTEGYFLMPVAKFIENYGLDDFDLSMGALKEITKRHTSEYAIRPYLAKNIDLCLEYFNEWVTDTNSHVRRLVSEGTRPRLPWAKKMEPIHNDPLNNLTLIQKLLHDTSPYVQKSVANHINDLTKDYPSDVLLWIENIIERHQEINTSLINHGLRTLIKKKDTTAEKIITTINRV